MAEQLPIFVLKPPADFWWEVRVPVPTDNDYAFAKMDVLFEAVDQATLDWMNGRGPAGAPPAPTDEQIALRVVRGWRELKDEHGSPVPFSEPALRQLLAAPRVRTALVGTFLAASSGAAARKNG